ncbi:MAG TPA: DUF1877 family protein [Actinospica sp.]|nr:DUF1877 family protein [Actinospica sp.]
MSILLNLWGITPRLYERIMSDEPVESYTWTRKTERVGKSWEVLFRVLAGPSGFQPGLPAIAVGGGWPIDDPREAEYGGGYILSPREVALIAPSLETIGDTAFTARFRTLSFTGLYGDAPEDPHADESALHAFHALRDFYRACAEAGDGVLKFLG